MDLNALLYAHIQELQKHFDGTVHITVDCYTYQDGSTAIEYEASVYYEDGSSDRAGGHETVDEAKRQLVKKAG
jgi:hypothetical protein